MFEMRLYPSKCEMLPRDKPESATKLMTGSEVVKCAGHLICFGIFISPRGLMFGGIPATDSKSSTDFANL